MDLMAPLVHEFTYQAMAHDLLKIKDDEKVTYHMKINEGSANEEDKDMELTEKDKVWVDNRHRHMKDTIDKLMGDFDKFLKQNPNFTNENSDTTSLNAIKDMLAGLPQFQEMKEIYSLHLTMAQECMNAFQHRKLPDVASAEQTLATGLDEDYRKPKNVLDQVVRLLDDEAIVPSDRLRLIMAYVLYRDGVILEDINRLLAHSSLPPYNGEIISNLELLGGRTVRGLKDVRPLPPPLFPIDVKTLSQSEEYALSRFEPNLKHMLDHLCKGTLDPTSFPYVKPPLDPNEEMMANQGSLRAAKPSWAGAGRRTAENRQRILIFMAGGATYSESRVCYDVSAARSRDVFLATSHMLTPGLFVRQVGDLSVDKRRLDLPMERPKPKAPAHLFEREKPAPPAMPPGPALGMGGGTGQPQAMGMSGQPGRGQRPLPPGGMPSGPRPPTQQMGQMSLGGVPGGGMRQPMNGGGGGSFGADAGSFAPGHDSRPSTSTSTGEGKLHKEEKKKRGLFGRKK